MTHSMQGSPPPLSEQVDCSTCKSAMPSLSMSSVHMVVKVGGGGGGSCGFGGGNSTGSEVNGDTHVPDCSKAEEGNAYKVIKISSNHSPQAEITATFLCMNTNSIKQNRCTRVLIVDEVLYNKVLILDIHGPPFK